MEEDRQTHTLPADPDAAGNAGAQDAAPRPPARRSRRRHAATRLREHLAAVRDIYDRVVLRARTAPPCRGRRAARAGRRPLQRREARFERFLEKRRRMRRGWRTPASRRVLRLFEHSAISPTSCCAIRNCSTRSASRSRSKAANCATRGAAALLPPADAAHPEREHSAKARRFSTRWARRRALADCVIARRIGSRHEMCRRRAYRPIDQMMVIALGRLGMREFDLGSRRRPGLRHSRTRADHRFWTGVAERIIHLVGSYTGEGVMFSIDTRLRPNGREGDLVQSESAYKSYFAASRRGMGGDHVHEVARGGGESGARHARFCTSCSRWTGGATARACGRAQELAQMRARLEKEQGARNPLKAGPGGYYDIDFALMYLRLRGAGIFYTC